MILPILIILAVWFALAFCATAVLCLSIKRADRMVNRRGHRLGKWLAFHREARNR